MYNCVVCGTALFSSETKFESGSGWPAFHDVLGKDKVLLKEENIGGLAFFFFNLLSVVVTSFIFLIYNSDVTSCTLEEAG